MGLNICNTLQALAIPQQAIFYKLAKANFIMESQSRATESTSSSEKVILFVSKWSKLIYSISHQIKLHARSV